VREELSEQNMTPKQIIRIGSRRWQILKKFAGDNHKSVNNIIENPTLLSKVAKNYASIDEDLEGLDITPKKTKTKKNTKEKKKTPEEPNNDKGEESSTNIINDSVASMFDMSDSEDEEDDE
jgi:hypothetical protein